MPRDHELSDRTIRSVFLQAGIDITDAAGFREAVGLIRWNYDNYQRSTRRHIGRTQAVIILLTAIAGAVATSGAEWLFRIVGLIK